MKRIISILICMSMLLCGCATAKPASGQTTPEPTTPPVTTPEPTTNPDHVCTTPNPDTTPEVTDTLDPGTTPEPTTPPATTPKPTNPPTTTPKPTNPPTTTPKPTNPPTTTPKPTTPPVTTPEPTTPQPTTPEPTTTPKPTNPADPAQSILDSMTVEEKVGQLFLAYCDESSAIQNIGRYHLGGFVLFNHNIRNENPSSLRSKLQSYQNASKIPMLIAVDEEGGTVTRVSTYTAFRSSKFPSPRDAFDKGGMEGALATQQEICDLLRPLGINVNLGPVCDVTQNPEAFMYKRSLGQDAETTGSFISQTVRIMRRSGIGSCLKHFPGYGENTDTHVGIAVDNRSLEELKSVDLVPFQAGINAGCGAVMVTHTYINAIDPNYPATLSPAVHSYLRRQMGFTGVIVTDDLAMKAITNRYGSGEAAVLAVLAGNDLLCSTDYIPQYKAVLNAVNSGKIPMSTLDAAVKRVLQWKINLGLI